MTGEHPWRRIRGRPDITVEWEDLPRTLMGFAEFSTKRIVLATWLSQAERRCVVEHEHLHLERGSVPEHLEAREERTIDALVARSLIPFDALVDAMLWSRDDYEIADELWVDVETVRTRLVELTASESDELNRRLDEAESRLP